MSLGQLDKTGCHISIKRGLLRIRDDRRRLLTQVQYTANRLYILKLEIEQPVNLSARYRKMEDLLGRGEPPGLAARQLEEEAARYPRMEDLLGRGEPPGLAARQLEEEAARYRRMEDLLGRGELPGLAARQLEEEVAEQDVEFGEHAARDTKP